jgi:hypothetical protein
MLKANLLIVALAASSDTCLAEGAIRFNGRVLASSCTVTLYAEVPEPSVSCVHTQPPRITIQRHPEPQLLVARGDVVYVLTYD